MQNKINDSKDLISNHHEVLLPEGYYSEKEVAGFLGKTIATLRVDHCHRRNNVPPKTKIGRVIIYSKASFKEWLESKEIKSFEHQTKWRPRKINMVR